MVNKKRKVSCGQERKKRESPPNTFTIPTPVFQVETVALHRILFLQFPQPFGNGRIERNGYAKPKSLPFDNNRAVVFPHTTPVLRDCRTHAQPDAGARECHVSQPSISGAVHHLEETFQTELFYCDPSRGFVVRHSGGRAFRPPVRRRAGSPDQRPRISPRPGLTLFPFPKTPAWGEGASAPRISPMSKMQAAPLRR